MKYFNPFNYLYFIFISFLTLLLFLAGNDVHGYGFVFGWHMTFHKNNEKWKFDVMIEDDSHYVSYHDIKCGKCNIEYHQKRAWWKREQQGYVSTGDTKNQAIEKAIKVDQYNN